MDLSAASSTSLVKPLLALFFAVDRLQSLYSPAPSRLIWRHCGGSRWESFIPVLIVTFPALVITIRCGQNGFLTGALIGLGLFYLRKGSSLAGLPLGLMVIKPHLAVAFAVYAIATRRWKTATVASRLLLGPRSLRRSSLDCTFGRPSSTA